MTGSHPSPPFFPSLSCLCASRGVLSALSVSAHRRSVPRPVPQGERSRNSASSPSSHPSSQGSRHRRRCAHATAAAAATPAAADCLFCIVCCCLCFSPLLPLLLPRPFRRRWQPHPRTDRIPRIHRQPRGGGCSSAGRTQVLHTAKQQPIHHHHSPTQHQPPPHRHQPAPAERRRHVRRPHHRQHERTQHTAASQHNTTQRTPHHTPTLHTTAHQTSSESSAAHPMLVCRRTSLCSLVCACALLADESRWMCHRLVWAPYCPPLLPRPLPLPLLRLHRRLVWMAWHTSVCRGVICTHSTPTFSSSSSQQRRLHRQTAIAALPARALPRPLQLWVLRLLV